MLVELVAEPHHEAGAPFAVLRDILVVVLNVEQVESGDDVAVEEVRDR